MDIMCRVLRSNVIPRNVVTGNPGELLRAMSRPRAGRRTGRNDSVRRSRRIIAQPIDALRPIGYNRALRAPRDFLSRAVV
jgi:hypothetical protein